MQREEPLGQCARGDRPTGGRKAAREEAAGPSQERRGAEVNKATGVWQRFETNWAIGSASASHRRGRKREFQAWAQVERVAGREGDIPNS